MNHHNLHALHWLKCVIRNNVVLLGWHRLRTQYIKMVWTQVLWSRRPEVNSSVNSTIIAFCMRWNMIANLTVHALCLICVIDGDLMHVGQTTDSWESIKYGLYNVVLLSITVATDENDVFQKHHHSLSFFNMLFRMKAKNTKRCTTRQDNWWSRSLLRMSQNGARPAR